jgi:hypothetical protein
VEKTRAVHIVKGFAPRRARREDKEEKRRVHKGHREMQRGINGYGKDI